MLVKKDFLNKLKEFGINSYEAKIWTALLSRGVSTAGELSDIANVPRSRSYDVLESLEKKGFVIQKVGKPIKYIAVPPQEAIERVKQKLQEDAATQLTQIESLKGSQLLDELSELHDQSMEVLDPLDITSVIKGRNNLYAQLNGMIKKAEKSITLVTNDAGLVRKHEALRKQFAKAQKRGVIINIHAPLVQEQETQQALTTFANLQNTKNPGRFCVVDDKEVLLMVTNDKVTHDYDTAVWVQSPFVAQTLKHQI